MGTRKISREEAEEAYTARLVGAPLDPNNPAGPKIAAVVLPDRPTPGGDSGKGYLPFAYEYSIDGRTHRVITASGPDVEEVRRFLTGTETGIADNGWVRLWFEDRK